MKSAAGRNVPGIPGACATRNFTYLVRGPWFFSIIPNFIHVDILWYVFAASNVFQGVHLFVFGFSRRARTLMRGNGRKQNVRGPITQVASVSGNLETDWFAFLIVNLCDLCCEKYRVPFWNAILGLGCLLSLFYDPWWRHEMKTFSALLALCAGNSLITCEFPSQRPVCGALMFSLICAWTNGCPNNRDAGDFRRHYTHIMTSL